MKNSKKVKEILFISIVSILIFLIINIFSYLLVKTFYKPCQECEQYKKMLEIKIKEAALYQEISMKYLKEKLNKLEKK